MSLRRWALTTALMAAEYAIGLALIALEYGIGLLQGVPISATRRRLAWEAETQGNRALRKP